MGLTVTDVPPMGVRADVTRRWFTEHFSENELHGHRLRKTIARTRTAFQEAVVTDSYSFGRCLLLDGEMQSAQLDEFIYHECLVHPAMMLHPRPRDVLVLGGGEGATMREILRHPSVQRVTMVDIDQDVVNLCKTHLTPWHQGAFSHPKTRLIIGDARRYVMETEQTFDVILSDLPTPTKAGPLYRLYAFEFYRRILKRLNPGGIFVSQAGSGNLLQIRFHAVFYNTLRQLFKVVRSYYAFVPSFDVPWAFLIGTQRRDPLSLHRAAINARVRRLRGPLRFYDGEAHEGLFRIPKYLRTILQKERRIIREKKPVLSFAG